MNMFKTLFRVGIPTLVGYFTGNPWIVGLSGGLSTKITGGTWKESLYAGVTSGLTTYAGGQIGNYFGAARAPSMAKIWGNTAASFGSKLASTFAGHFVWQGVGAAIGSYMANRQFSKMRKLAKERKNLIDDVSAPLPRRNLGIEAAPEDPVAKFAENYVRTKKNLSKLGINTSTEPKYDPLEQIASSPHGLQDMNVEAVHPANRPQERGPEAGANDPPHRSNSQTHKSERVAYIHKPRYRENRFNRKSVYV